MRTDGTVCKMHVSSEYQRNVLLRKLISQFEDPVCSLLKLLLKFLMVSYYLTGFPRLKKYSPSNGNLISVDFITIFFF